MGVCGYLGRNAGVRDPGYIDLKSLDPFGGNEAFLFFRYPVTTVPGPDPVYAVAANILSSAVVSTVMPNSPAARVFSLPAASKR
jgi:hypothetical protein